MPGRKKDGVKPLRMTFEGGVFDDCALSLVLLDERCRVSCLNAMAKSCFKEMLGRDLKVGETITGALPREFAVDLRQRIAGAVSGVPSGVEIEIADRLGGRSRLGISLVPVRLGNKDRAALLAHQLSSSKDDRWAESRLEQLRRLGDVAVKIAGTEPGQNLQSLLADEIRVSSGAASVIFFEYDHRKRGFKPLRLSSAPGAVADTMGLLWEKVRDRTFRGRPNPRRRILTRAISITDGNIVRDLPRELAARLGGVRNLLNFGGTISFTMTIGREVVGVALLFFSKDTPLPPMEYLKALANLCALAFRRGRAEEALAASERKYRGLCRELESLHDKIERVREDERKLIAREIHDELGQALTALRLHIATLKDRLDGVPPTLSSRLDHSIAIIDGQLSAVKRIYTEFRPMMLDELGLGAATKWYANEFVKYSSIMCDLSVKPPDLALDEAASVVFFRILQETLTNIARHAGASSVSISLIKDGRFATLVIRDDGKGIEKDDLENPRSLGIISMRERARQIGAALDIARGRNSGTMVRLILPLAGRQEPNGGRR